MPSSPFRLYSGNRDSGGHQAAHGLHLIERRYSE